MSKSGGQFTNHEKFIVIWVLIVLIPNTLNFIADNIFDFVNVFLEYDPAIDRFRIEFASIFFELLDLNNGLFILLLYRQMARIQ